MSHRLREIKVITPFDHRIKIEKCCIMKSVKAQESSIDINERDPQIEKDKSTRLTRHRWLLILLVLI
jgi:hypothetical protein